MQLAREKTQDDQEYVEIEVTTYTYICIINQQFSVEKIICDKLLW